ncbi:MAG: ankyrin repeat domain-containing protein [Burkholderiaceae bacterium]
MSNLKSETARGRRRLLRAGCAAAIGALLPALAGASAFDDFFKAVKFDQADRVRALLQRGIDPNTVEPVRGETGLMVALREKSMKSFAVLMESRGIDLGVRARNGDTALMIAAYTGNRPAVEALIARGAEVNQVGWTALHYAAAAGHNDVVQLLLEHHAYIDAESPNKTTPLMMAARGGHILTVKLLLDEGADLGLKNDLGMTALDFAKKHEKKDIVEGLTYRMRKAGKL